MQNNRVTTIDNHQLTIVHYMMIVLLLLAGSLLCAFAGDPRSTWPTGGGEGGREIVVTSLDENGPGTLREALDADGPRIIRFAVAGEIWLSKILRIGKPYVTIDGASAPSPGISIMGDCVRIRTHDVIIRDIRIRAGARNVGSHPDNRDCLQIDGGADGKSPSYNILIENCSFAWSVDETVQIWGKGNHDIVIRRCIIAEALKQSLHAKGDHSAGLIVGPGVTQVLIQQNLFAHNSFRNPVVASGTSTIVANNLIYNPGFNAFHIYGHEGYGPTHVDVLGNLVIAGPNTRPKLGIFHNRTGLIPASRVWLNGNEAIGTASFDQTEWPPNWHTDVPTPFSRHPVVELPVQPDVLPAGKVESYVLSHVGARINDRDATDKRIINEVKTRTGQIRNWPEDKRLLPDPSIKNPGWTTKSNDAPPIKENIKPPERNN